MSDRTSEALGAATPSRGSAPRRRSVGNRGLAAVVAGILAQLIAGAALMLAISPVSELFYPDSPRPHWSYLLEAAALVTLGALGLGAGIRLLPPRSGMRTFGIMRIVILVLAGGFLSLAVVVLTNIFDATNDSSDALYVGLALMLAAIGAVLLAAGLWLVRRE